MNELNKIHILFLPSFYPTYLDYPRGNFFQEQARMLHESGVQIGVVYNERRSLSSLNIKRLKVAHFQTNWEDDNGVSTLRRKSWNIVPTKFILGEKIWMRLTRSLVRKYIREKGKPDIIHAQCLLYAGFVASNISEEYGIPFIISEHSTYFSLNNIKAYLKEKFFKIYIKASKVLVVSSPFKQLLIEKIGIPKKCLSIVPNFIDVNFFNPDIISGIDGQIKKHIFCVCYHEKKKRLDRLISSFKIVQQQFPELKLIIGGEGPETKNLKEKVQSLFLNDNIFFPGFLTQYQIRSFLKNSLLFVLPSDVETFGVVLLEAMSMGVPVVATRSGGPEDFVNEANGILVDRTERDLAIGIMSVLNNQCAFDNNQIRGYIIQSFSALALVPKYIDIYKEVINSKFNN